MSARIVQIATGEGAEHENTLVEGSFYRKVFAANELQPGKVYPFSCPVIVNDTNSTDTLTIAVRFGTSAVPASNTLCGAGSAINVEDADVGVAFGWVEVHSTTRAVVYGGISGPDTNGTVALLGFAAVVTIAPNTAYNLDVTGDWSVANADNEAAAMGGHVAEIVS
jgi:hypothetical protein